jgi:ATP-dependent helicase HrpB
MADRLSVYEYLAVAELGGQANQRDDHIYLAAPLNAQLFASILEPLVTQEESLAWDVALARFVGEHQSRIGALVIQREPLKKIPLEVKRKALIQLVRQKGLGMLPWNKAVSQWRGRIECLRALPGADEKAQWPDVSDQHLLETLEHWLQPYLDNINKLDDFQKLDLQSCLVALLPWPGVRLLNELAPQSIKVPSGSSIKIDYTRSPPVLEVKLQEMFGCLQTPAIAEGKIDLVVHLLSPAGKPLQITQDLGGFWSGSYEQVKKEMKGRYPKHPWPDDPLQADPTRFTKHRKK